MTATLMHVILQTAQAQPIWHNLHEWMRQPRIILHVFEIGTNLSTSHFSDDFLSKQNNIWCRLYIFLDHYKLQIEANLHTRLEQTTTICFSSRAPANNVKTYKVQRQSISLFQPSCKPCMQATHNLSHSSFFFISNLSHSSYYWLREETTIFTLISIIHIKDTWYMSHSDNILAETRNTYRRLICLMIYFNCNALTFI